MRGLWQTTQAKTIALGTSSDWLQGELETSAAQQASLRQLCQVADLGPCEFFVPPPVDQAGVALHQQVQTVHPQLILRELENLRCLNGQPQANASVRRAHIWFPVLCGAAEPDRLLSLAIILRRHRYAEGQSDEFIFDGKVTSLSAMKSRPSSTACASTTNMAWANGAPWYGCSKMPLVGNLTN